MQTNFIIDLIKRIASGSPKFFKVLQIVCALLAIIAGAGTWLLEANIWHPDNIAALQEVFKGMTAFFSGSFIAALTGTTNPKLMDTTTKENVVEHVKNNLQ